MRFKLDFFKHISHLDHNIRLYLVTSFLVNVGVGVFSTDFNLYILSMGISAELLGVILSLTPFAQALASIPIGFLAEKIGHKHSLIMVNSVVGIAYLLRVISPNPVLIMAGMVLTGVMACGYFIIQLPFISHYAGEYKNSAFVLSSMVFFTALAFGSLLGGFLPHMVNSVVMNETQAFRLVLMAFSLLVLAGTIPLLFLDEDRPDDSRQISLSPYLSGIDGSTVKLATIELFIGIGLAFLMYFMNIIFIFYYQSSLELFGAINALLIFPTLLFLFIGPSLAAKYGEYAVAWISRLMAAVFALLTIVTINPYLGGGAYILFRAFMGLAQSLWFAFAVSVATRRSRMATAAWLEITFQIGLGTAALIGGWLIESGAYPWVGIISGLAMAVSFVLTGVFFGRDHLGKILQPTGETKPVSKK